MCRFLLVIFFFSYLALPAVSLAQEATPEPFEIEGSGEDYLKSLRFSGIQPDVTYYDPDGPVPPLDTKQKPEPAPQNTRDGERTTGDWIIGGIAAAILGLIGFAVYRFGGGLSVSLKRDSGRDFIEQRTNRNLCQSE